jgi:hypothetical protein
MTRLPAILSDGFLKALPLEETKRLGKAGMTAEEIKLQRLCMNWLLLHDIYFEWDRVDKRTSWKKGRADFRICFKGRWISAECKATGEKLSPHQSEQAARLRRSGGIFLVVFSLEELIKALGEIDSPALTFERPFGR